MNKAAILKTAVCRYDKKGKLYIVESPLLDNFSGCEAAEAEAWTVFRKVVDELWVDYLEGKAVGRQYSRRGRPAKNRVNLTCQVKPITSQQLKEHAREFGTSQGEFIDYLYASWLAGRAAPSHNVSVDRVHVGTKQKSSGTNSLKSK
jgi:hypothetical protein